MVPGFPAVVAPRVRNGIARARRVLGRLHPGKTADDGDHGSTRRDDGDERSEGAPAALEEQAELVRYRPDAADFDVVIDGLRRSDPASRELSSRALAGTPASALPRATEAIPALVRCLNDGRLAVRRYSARALARLAPIDPAGIRAEAPSLVESISAHNLRVSRNVTDALAAAAASSPEEVAPLVFQYVDAETRATTRRNALLIVERAARTSPASVEPIVPRIVDLVNRGFGDRSGFVRAIAAVSGEFPELVAPAVPALVSVAEGHEENGADAAIEALARLGNVDPTTARPAVPALAEHLTGEDPVHADSAATALVRIVDRHPDERDRVLSALETADGMERLRAARTLAAVDDAGGELAEAIMGESPLRRYLER